MQMLALSFINIKALTKNNKGLLMGKLIALRPEKYVGLDLTWLDTKTFVSALLKL